MAKAKPNRQGRLKAPVQVAYDLYMSQSGDRNNAYDLQHYRTGPSQGPRDKERPAKIHQFKGSSIRMEKPVDKTELNFNMLSKNEETLSYGM